jgi:hypothetical protein
VVELTIGLFDRKREMPGQRTVTGDLRRSVIRHVEVAHQDHRFLQRREVALDPPQLQSPPARHVGKVGVGDDDQSRRGAEPPDHRSPRLLFDDDHFSGSAEVQRDRGWDPR